MRIKNISIIIFSLLISFIVTDYFSNNVFIAKSPIINPYYFVNLKNDFIRSKNIFLSLFRNPFSSSDFNNMEEVPVEMFKPLTTGVSAYESDEGQTYLKIKKGTQYKIKQIQLSDGTVINAIDFTNH